MRELVSSGDETHSSTHGIQNSIQQGMGQNLHWFAQDVDANQLAETMVGMANSGGGRILLGISSHSNRPNGLKDPEYVVDKVFQAALEISPTLVIPVPEIIHEFNKTFLSVEIPEGLPHVYNLDGRYVYRRGTSTTLIPPKILRQMLVNRGVVNFEAKVPEGTSLDDLDPVLIDEYRKVLKIDEGNGQHDFLLRRGCLQRVDGSLVPTYAGLLLFGSNPQQWLPSASILAVRFPGSTLSDSFVKQEIGGNLISQLNRAETFIRDHTPRKGTISGMQRVEEEIYPVDVVRELIVNAITHRDYNNQGDHIHLQIYSDRLMVRSPGELPGPVTLENLFDVRFSRNPVIAQVLSDFGYVERFGYGLNRVLRILMSRGLPKPVFKEIGGCFEVSVSTLVGEATPLPAYPHDEDNPLNDRQLSALKYLSTHKRITNRAYQQLTPDVSPETLRRDLVDMVKRGILLKIGSKRSTYYILKKR